MAIYANTSGLNLFFNEKGANMAAKDTVVEPKVIQLKNYKVPPFLVDDVNLDFLLFSKKSFEFI